MEAILADSSSRIEAVFPREAVKLWQTTIQSQLTSFPSGTLFHVLDAELRISNCFLPPRIELWVHSFEIVGNLGRETPSSTREIGVSSELRRLLQLYGESDERTRIKNQVTASMSSHFRSQESVCSPNGSSDDADDIENSEPKGISQPFYTQISQPSEPKQGRQPLMSKQPRACQDKKSNRRTSMQDTPTLLLAKKGTRTPVDLAGGSMNNVEYISEQLIANAQDQNTIREKAPGISTPTDLTGISRSRRGSTSMNDDHWPGGKSALLHGRYIPRYLTKVSKEQQEVLESPHVWQPSKADRKIRGSVPNEILKDFTALADETPETASNEDRFHQEESAPTEEPKEDVHLDHGKDKEHVDAGSDSEESLELSWPPTPRIPALSEPALPDNSSPLPAPPRRAAPSSSPNGIPAASADDASQRAQGVEMGVPVPSQREKIGFELREVSEAVQTTLCAQMLPEPVKNVPDPAGSDEDRGDVHRLPSLEYPLSPGGDKGQLQDVQPSRVCLGQADPINASQQIDAISVARRIQNVLSYPEAEGKALIQVQRTPFVHQLSTLVKGTVYHAQGVVPPCPTDYESMPNGGETKSSPSFVPGTFINAQVRQHRHLEVSSTRSLLSQSDIAEDERIEADAGSEIINISKIPKAVDAAPNVPPSSTCESQFESQDRISQGESAKRKYCSDDSASPNIQSHPSTEDHQPRWSPAPSKRPRMLSSFPSLDALTDLCAAKAPSAIARESRREFSRSQRRAASSSSPLLVGTPTLDKTKRKNRLANSQATGRIMSHWTQQRHTTPRTSLLSHAGSKRESGVDVISRLSLGRQSVYDTYKATYPEYQGTALHFHKACKQLKILHSEGRAPHPSLWDDFIFRRHHDYRDYLLEVTEACEDALPYLQYYIENVEKPSHMLLVVRPPYILSLISDSTTGSSVESPAPAVDFRTDAMENLEESVAASSSASNILPTQHRSASAVASAHRQRHDLRHKLKSPTRNEPEQTQKSCVKQWVELQSIEKPLGAESPELGYTDVMEEEDVPQQDLDNPAEIPVSPFPIHQPALPEQEDKESVWCDDPNTPFKRFARSYITLASESKQLKKPVKIDGKGCLEPQLQSVIDIFTLYRK